MECLGEHCNLEARKMVREVKAPTAFTEDLSFVPGAQVGWLTDILKTTFPGRLEASLRNLN